MQEKATQIIDKLRQRFGAHPACELRYRTAWELLVAIILSAQCTDKRVNMTTPALFAAFPTVADMANAALPAIENIIRPCGFYHTKAKHLQQTAKIIARDHNGTVPNDIAALTKMAGVGEKTASVFVSEFYNTPAIGVDTHITRVSHRLGLSAAATPSQISHDLRGAIPPADWRDAHILLVLFGRYTCTARQPHCAECPFQSDCDWFNSR